MKKQFIVLVIFMGMFSTSLFGARWVCNMLKCEGDFCFARIFDKFDTVKLISLRHVSMTRGQMKNVCYDADTEVLPVGGVLRKMN